MALKGKKFYAVRKGKETGIFYSWSDCEKQVKGYSGAEYKSFKIKEEAMAYLFGNKKSVEDHESGKVIKAYVDGSYNHLTKEYSCGVVILIGGEKITFNKKENDLNLRTMRNVAGELLGAKMAMEYAIHNEIEKVIIYHDYEGIAKWCRGEWKTNKEGTKEYKRYYDSVCNKIHVEFVKVKAHSGDLYNEEADRLAKDALAGKIVR